MLGSATGRNRHRDRLIPPLFVLLPPPAPYTRYERYGYDSVDKWMSLFYLCLYMVFFRGWTYLGLKYRNFSS